MKLSTNIKELNFLIQEAVRKTINILSSVNLNEGRNPNLKSIIKEELMKLFEEQEMVTFTDRNTGEKKTMTKAQFKKMKNGTKGTSSKTPKRKVKGEKQIELEQSKTFMIQNLKECTAAIIKVRNYIQNGEHSFGGNKFREFISVAQIGKDANYFLVQARKYLEIYGKINGAKGIRILKEIIESITLPLENSIQAAVDIENKVGQLGDISRMKYYNYIWNGSEDGKTVGFQNVIYKLFDAVKKANQAINFLRSFVGLEPITIDFRATSIKNAEHKKEMSQKREIDMQNRQDQIRQKRMNQKRPSNF